KRDQSTPAGVAEPRERLVTVESQRTDVELDEVRLHLIEVDRQPGRMPALRQPVRASVILGQAVDVVLECIHTARCDDPGPADRPAEQVLLSPCPLDRLRRAGEQRSERAAQALRETERDGVEHARDLRFWDPVRYG